MVPGHPEISVNLRISGDFSRDIPFPDDIGKRLERALEVILLSIDPASGFSSVELDLTLTDDREIRRVNLKHRGIDEATDVLSFPMLDGETVPGENESGPPVSMGDIVISMETVARQASEREISSLERFCECFVHGVLHLLGRSHDEEKVRESMEAEEDRLVGEVLDEMK